MFQTDVPTFAAEVQTKFETCVVCVKDDTNKHGRVFRTFQKANIINLLPTYISKGSVYCLQQYTHIQIVAKFHDDKSIRNVIIKD